MEEGAKKLTEHRIIELEKKVGQMESIIGDTSKDIVTIKGDIRSIDNKLSEVNGKQKSMDELNYTVREVMMRLDILIDNNECQKGEFSKYVSEHDKENGEIKTRVEELESKAGKAALTVVKQVGIIVGTSLITFIIGLLVNTFNIIGGV